MESKTISFEVKESPRIVHRVFPSDFGNRDNRAQELLDEISEESDGEIELDLRTLRWYATIGAIDKPEKRGRVVYYPPQTRWELYGLQILQQDYDLSIAEITELKKAGASHYRTVYALYNLERKLMAHMSFPTLSEFLENLESKFKNQGERRKPLKIVVTPQLHGKMQQELIFLPWNLYKDIPENIRYLRREFFKLVKSGVDPRKVDLFIQKK